MNLWKCLKEKKYLKNLIKFESRRFIWIIFTKHIHTPSKVTTLPSDGKYTWRVMKEHKTRCAKITKFIFS